jgi:hypothetical protein
MRRRLVILGVAAAAGVGAGVVAIVPLGEDGPSKAKRTYIGRVDEICRRDNLTLAQLPSPLGLANPALIAQLVDKALPVVERRARSVAAIEPPSSIRSKVDALFAASDRALADLRAARATGRRDDLRGSLAALGRFVGDSDTAHAIGVEIGLHC